MDPYSWALHWEVFLAIAALAAVYYATQRRWPSDTRRRVAFDIALILLLAVYVTPINTIALHYLLSVHFLQNVVTAEWAPALVVLAVAPSLGRRVARHIQPVPAPPLAIVRRRKQALDEFFVRFRGLILDKVVDLARRWREPDQIKTQSTD